MLKYHLLFSIFSIFIFSCKSPTQQAIDENNPPNLIVILNDTTFDVGDTLKMTISASDPTLNFGQIAFGDSVLLSFEHCDQELDTVFQYVFKDSGTYAPTISFSDGEKTTTKRFQCIVSWNAPVVIVNPESITIANGDTLKLRVKVTDATLKSGVIDFMDGSKLVFSALNKVLDTVVTHIYSKNGTYLATASFTDGYEFTSKSVSVTVKYYLTFSFSVGMKWRFAYSYSTSTPYKQTGIHYWNVHSITPTSQDTLISIRQIRNDTVQYQSSPVIIQDTAFFALVYSFENIQLKWPAIHTTFNSFNIPNNIFVDSTIYFYRFQYSSTSFDAKNGPIHYQYYDYPSYRNFNVERFDLIDFYK